MIKYALLYLLCSCLAVYSSNPLAQTNKNYENVLSELKQLIANNEFDLAYELSSNKFEYLGEPAFDFLLGIAALKTNQPDPAVFAFERVVNSTPRWYEARLHLIRAYIAINNLPAANSQMKILINFSETPLDVKNKAKELVENTVIEQGSNHLLTHNVGVALGFDGNVNAGTAEDTIVIPQLGEFLLSQDSKSNDDSYLLVKYNGLYSYALNKNSNVSFNVNNDWYTFSKLNQYDRLNTQLNARYQYKHNNLVMFAKTGITPLVLDGDLYRTESAFTVGANYKPQKHYTLFSALTVGQLNNLVDEKLDNSFYSLTAGGSYISGAWFHSVSVNAKSENADLASGEFNSRDYTSVYYQANTQLASQWQLLSLVGYQSINYQAEHPLFLQQRDDNLLMLSSSIRHLVNNDLAVTLAANYQDKTSNIPLFEYDRLDINLSVNYAF
jgi:hypothetical protein